MDIPKCKFESVTESEQKAKFIKLGVEKLDKSQKGH